MFDELFWTDPRTIRYGAGENLCGAAEILAFCQSRPSCGLMRGLQRTQITTFGRDCATAMTLFRRDGSQQVGRQSRTWVRTLEGWRVVAVHVSLIDEP